MQSVRWGIIGCGDVTEVKSGPALQQTEHSELVAVMRRTGALARDYAARHDVPRWYDDADALIADPGVDAVYIATPPDSHRDYTLRCAKAGKPVYVEKPMAMNAGECREMIEACASAGVPLFVAYYRRALERFVRIKALIDDGAIGDVRFVRMTFFRAPMPEDRRPGALPWRVRPEIAGGGYFLDLASHMLDFMDFALGPVRDVEGFAGNQGGLYEAEDVVTGAFTFESGVQGVGSWCFTASEPVDETLIVGSKGTITFSTFDAQPIVVSTGAGRTESSIAYPPHIQQPLIATVVNALRGEGTCPSTGESAMRTSWVMDQMLRGGRSRTSRSALE